jgi:hypothetical protein
MRRMRPEQLPFNRFDEQNMLPKIDIDLSAARISYLTDADGNLTTVKVNSVIIDIPTGDFETFFGENERDFVVVEDFSGHVLNMRNRNGRDTDHERITQNQEYILVTIQQQDGLTGWAVPRRFDEGAVVSQLNCMVDDHGPDFKIDLFEVHNGQPMPTLVHSPREDSKILHATQILGHVKDACDMQAEAFSKGELFNWQFAFPPTKRTTINQLALKNAAVPTDLVTTNWAYGPESEELPSDFRRVESFPTILAFLAANHELCRAVANGDFSVISTNFKQEASIFKMINPEVTLTGINFSFLSGRPGERVARHGDLPTLQTMLARVQDSLDNAPDVLTRIVGRPVEAADWWKLVEEKMQNLDVLFYRTFDFDPALPKQVGATEIIQIPHPVPEVRFTKEESRALIAEIIGRPILDHEKVVLLPGTSEDGFFQQRTEEVLSVARKRDDVIVLLPLSPTDERLENIEIPNNAFTIGYREDWMDILPGADTTIMRGSWGEILDVIAAGVVPVISSLGTVAEEGDPGYIQFLSEVAGERAVNVSLFVEELQKKGVSTDTLNKLLADVADPSQEGSIAAAIDSALDDDLINEVREALSKTQRNGIYWMVQLHELMRQFGADSFKDNPELVHAAVWEEQDTN